MAGPDVSGATATISPSLWQSLGSNWEQNWDQQAPMMEWATTAGPKDCCHFFSKLPGRAATAVGTVGKAVLWGADGVISLGAWAAHQGIAGVRGVGSVIADNAQRVDSWATEGLKANSWTKGAFENGDSTAGQVGAASAAALGLGTAAYLLGKKSYKVLNGLEVKAVEGRSQNYRLRQIEPLNRPWSSRVLVGGGCLIGSVASGALALLTAQGVLQTVGMMTAPVVT